MECTECFANVGGRYLPNTRGHLKWLAGLDQVLSNSDLISYAVTANNNIAKLTLQLYWCSHDSSLPLYFTRYHHIFSAGL